MANLAGYPGNAGYGFDRDRSLLVVSTKSPTLIYLVAGAGLDVSIDDESVATWSQGRTPKTTKGLPLTAWEQQQDIRVLCVQGKRTGQATLNAFLDGRPWILPLEIRVVDNVDRRQAGDGGTITPKLRQELQGLSLREAVVRVAQDQMNSSIGQSASGGNGRYDDAGINWCGSFVYWCFAQASLATGVTNPLGNRSAVNNPIRSGIKAHAWGMKNASSATVLQYEGPDRFGGLKTKQPLVRLGASNTVKAGDIALPRKDHGDTFPHVCMVLDPPGEGGGPFTTIDGNQFGAHRPEGSNAKTCIGTCGHDSNDMLTVEGKQAYKWVFVHFTAF